MVFLPIMVRIDKKTVEKVMERYSLLSKSKLIREHPERDDIIIRMVGSIYIDGDYNFFICNDECSRADYLRNQYFKMLEMVEKMRRVRFKGIRINNVEYSRWI